MSFFFLFRYFVIHFSYDWFRQNRRLLDYALVNSTKTHLATRAYCELFGVVFCNKLRAREHDILLIDFLLFLHLYSNIN